MKRTFLQAKEYLESQFPNQLAISGENSPIPPIIELLLNVLTLIQLFTIAAVIFGERIFFGYRAPSIYYRIKEYGFMFAIAIFWIIPQVLNKWVMTGAFEVFVDGTKIFSKLESGQMPSATDLTTPLLQMGLQQIES